MSDYKLLLVPFLGWVFAQSIKLLSVNRRQHLGVASLYQSGGMPSAHTAFLSGLSALLLIELGADSPVFALSLAVLSLVAYDSVNLRRSVGQQAEIINKLIQARPSSEGLRPVVVRNGHTVIEAVAGILLGVVLAALVSYLM